MMVRKKTRTAAAKRPAAATAAPETPKQDSAPSSAAETACEPVGPVTLKLEGELTIRDVVQTREHWRQALARATSLAIDASGLHKIDTAALQLLVALGATARSRGVECRIQQPSPAMREAVANLGLSAALGLDDAGRVRG
jgi:anti-anti-sigma regulatory factor